MRLTLPLFVCAFSVAYGQIRPTAGSELAGGNLPIQKIGANDLIAISVYDAPELTRAVRVSAAG
jgi:hypothetical protein